MRTEARQSGGIYTVQVTEADRREFRQYLLEQERSNATIQKYMTDIRTFFSFLNGNELVTKEHLLNYKEMLLKRYALSSVNSMIAALNQFLLYLGSGELRLRRVRIQRQMFAAEERQLTQGEYLRLLEAARKQGKEQLAMIMETICGTGIRISELAAITVESVQRGQAEVANKGKHRVVLIPRKLQRKLKSYLKRRNIREGCVFVTKNGKPKNRSNVWSEMKALARSAGIDEKKIFPHNLRHLFARTFYQLTKNLVSLAAILGHSNLETTRIYTSESLKSCRHMMDETELFREVPEKALE